MQEVANQEAEPYSRTSVDIAEYAETKVLQSIEQNCIDWSCRIKPLNGPNARSPIRIQILIWAMWQGMDWLFHKAPGFYSSDIKKTI